MGDDGTEIELALRATPGDAERLLASPTLAEMSRGVARRARLVSTYFDTPDLQLRAVGAVLRLRKQGRRVVQTLKTAPRPGDPAALRGEISRTVRGAGPDLGGAEEGAVLAELGLDAGIAATLVPIFVTDFERIAVPLALGGSTFELAVDRGEIRAGGAVAALCDVEIELRAGAIGDLYAVALALHAAVPMALQPLAKSARAHALRAGGTIAPMRAERPRLARKVAIGPAFRGILRTCLAQLRANAAAIDAGDDPVAVHQFRVALRRLRSAFAAFAAAMPAAERRRFSASLRRVARRSDAARELDVFVAEMLPALRRRIGDPEALAAVEAVAESARAVARDRVRAMLRDPGFAATVLRLEAWVEGEGWRRAARDAYDMPARGHARDTLRRLQRKLLRDGRAIGDLEAEALHRLRLRAKKLRYAAEFFRDLFPRSGARGYLAALAGVQDQLGALNDSVTLRALLARLGRRRVADRAAFARGSAAVLGWCAAREAGELERLPAAWERFRDRRSFWA
jgi:inorganic triphosphatase YgiF